MTSKIILMILEFEKLQSFFENHVQITIIDGHNWMITPNNH